MVLLMLGLSYFFLIPHKLHMRQVIIITDKSLLPTIATLSYMMRVYRCHHSKDESKRLR